MADDNSRKGWRQLLSFVQSVLAALVGVQSKEKQESDFSEGGLERMLAITFVCAIVFVLIVLFMVNLALP
ncbi:MAG: DUF2970 domain-containing protein [Gammaproteobacteria bacterium]|nr:DUF2970 domain-containing protein [Gammaproteobacteria bacterium]MCP4881902.1 DUF2970 domain-containing protein [Gammaproteobacteria bacterium]